MGKKKATLYIGLGNGGRKGDSEMMMVNVLYYVLNKELDPVLWNEERIKEVTSDFTQSVFLPG
jgi:hypothetical protein